MSGAPHLQHLPKMGAIEDRGPRDAPRRGTPRFPAGSPSSQPRVQGGERRGKEGRGSRTLLGGTCLSSGAVPGHRRAGSPPGEPGLSPRKVRPSPRGTRAPALRLLPWLPPRGPRLPQVSPPAPYLLETSEAVPGGAQQRAQLQQPRGQRQVLRRSLRHGCPPPAAGTALGLPRPLSRPQTPGDPPRRLGFGCAASAVRGAGLEAGPGGAGPEPRRGLESPRGSRGETEFGGGACLDGEVLGGAWSGWPGPRDGDLGAGPVLGPVLLETRARSSFPNPPAGPGACAAS